MKEPIPGKYDWVYDLDLTSMYPNIMISLNISPETKYAKVDNFDAISWANKIQNEFVVENKKYSREEFKQFLITNNLSLASNGVMYTLDKQGFIPTLLVNWFNKRKEYRKLAKECKLKGDIVTHDYYDRLQQAWKLLLNSSYGNLGMSLFRFYDAENAEAVTTTGVTIIQMTGKSINKFYNDKI